MERVGGVGFCGGFVVCDFVVCGGGFLLVVMDRESRSGVFLLVVMDRESRSGGFLSGSFYPGLFISGDGS